ncbi:hypothetical protein TGARI_202065 [Toxoplasma gondii ARI]|uniref:Uncharacterized protein n=1 Tax=Toxoplasma gondii ARI TaxID=1074872 RepID=A0A139XZ65_TOXGO|nr:hypothetical protein TGARI_202065 [Toxoplasma gondii ARI]
MKECVMNSVVKVMRVTSFQTLEKYSDAFSVKAVVWRDSWRNACTHRHQVMLSSMILHDQTNDLDMKHYCCCMSITCAREFRHSRQRGMTLKVLSRCCRRDESRCRRGGHGEPQTKNGIGSGTRPN